MEQQSQGQAEDLPNQWDGALHRLREALGEDNISVRYVEKLAYAQDSWPQWSLHYQRGKLPPTPDIIAWPESQEQIAQIVAIAHEFAMPFIAYGGGSGMAGGTVPVRGGIVIDMKNLNRVLSLDEEHFAVTAETGILHETLENYLNAHGYTLGHFPGSVYIATLGGSMAVGGVGQHVSYYGTLPQMVKSLKGVLPDGSVLTTEESDHSYAQLDQLAMGSEGTLGVLTEATLSIHKLPEYRSIRGVVCDSVEQALHVLKLLRQSGLQPSLLRVYDEFDSMVHRSMQTLLATQQEGSEGKDFFEQFLTAILGVAHRFGPFRVAQEFLLDRAVRNVDTLLRRAPLVNQIVNMMPTEVLMIVGFDGMDENLVERNVDRAMEFIRAQGCHNAGPKVGQAWHSNRFGMAFNRSHIFYSGAFVDRIEVSTSWDHVLDIYHKVRERIADEVFVMAHFPHAYTDGCSILFTIAGATGRPRLNEKLYEMAVDEILQVVHEYGGSVSHHYGIGLKRGKHLPDALGDSGMTLARAVKTGFDRHVLSNPGKLV